MCERPGVVQVRGVDGVKFKPTIGDEAQEVATARGPKAV
jgi:hypothetical protein